MLLQIMTRQTKVDHLAILTTLNAMYTSIWGWLAKGFGDLNLLSLSKLPEPTIFRQSATNRCSTLWVAMTSLISSVAAAGLDCFQRGQWAERI